MIRFVPYRATLRALAAALVVLAAGACGDSTGPGGSVNITVSPSVVTLAVADSITLSATVQDADGQPLAGDVTWKSSNTQRATVTGTGVVHALSAGSVTITASQGGTSAAAAITITTTGAPSLHELLAGYLGGSDEDMARDVAVDAQGNIYVVGSTFSPDFPTTAGVLGPSFGGTSDAFIVKFSPSGSVLWSTFLGGPNYERAYAVEVDGSGNVVVAGRAGSGFPVTAGSFQTTFQGGTAPDGGYGPQDGFVCKIRPDGTSALFCSYFGTNDPWIVRDVAVDAGGNVYVASAHSGGTFPAAWLAGAYQPNAHAGHDGVLAKIASDGSSVVWATYIGGSGDESTTPSIGTDAGGNVYYLTSTDSPDLPTPAGFDKSLSGGGDLYLARFSATGGSLLYGTYIGGSGNEFLETHQLAVDAAGNAYVSAMTTSTNFPTTSGAFQAGNRGGSESFVTRISPSGALAASTYLGGNGSETTQGIAVGANGTINVAGSTSSSNFPVTVSAGSGGGQDVFVVSLSSDLRQMRFGATLGGSRTDIGRGLAVSGAGALYVVGHSNSTDWPKLNVAAPFQGVMDGVLAAFGP